MQPDLETKVPPNVLGSWQQILDSLAVQRNRWRQNMDVLPTCNICGTGEGDGYHAVMLCMKARSLRCALRLDWNLQADRELTHKD